jgi:chemotaxis protein methyltransferase CheR
MFRVEAPRLTAAQFATVRRLLYELSGINLHPGKENLVRNQLSKRMRALGLRTFREYFRYVEEDQTGRELSELVDALSTNKTSFFREPVHFEFLRDSALPELRQKNLPLRFWSAGCSSGEEPYTLAMVLSEELPEPETRRVRILGTDISSRMLARAREGIYDESAVRPIPPLLLGKYFQRLGARPPHRYRVNDQLLNMVQVARLNLFGPWPMKRCFTVIFCRNVIIYFDKPEQQQLIQRFWDILAPGGYLFIGHSESLAGLSHCFRYVQPAIYAK